MRTFLLALSLVFMGCVAQLSRAQDKFWVQTNGPAGGRFTIITVDASGNIYCAAQGGNIFQSSDNGESWDLLFLGATRHDILFLDADAEGYLYFFANKELFRGNTQTNAWEKIDLSSADLKTSFLCVLPQGTLFRGTNAGLYGAVRFDKSWTKIPGFDLPISYISRDKNDVYVLANDSLFFHSSDQGETWRDVGVIEKLLINRIAIGTDGRLFVGTRDGFVFRAGEQKNEWEQIAQYKSNGVTALEIEQTGDLYVGLSGPAFGKEGGGIYLIPSNTKKPKLIFKDNSNSVWCIAFKNGDIYAGTNEGFYKSGGTGNAWVHLEAGLIAQRINDIVITKNDILFVGSYGGVFRSDDNGNTWIKKNNRLDDIGILDMAVDRNYNLFVSTYTSTVFRSSDLGNTWRNTSKGLPQNNWLACLAVTSRNDLFVATSKTGIYRSVDNAETWHAVNRGLEAGFYSALVIDSKNVVYTANTEGNAFRSEDNGETWHKIHATNPIGDTPAELVVDSQDRLYFGAVEKGIFRYSKNDQAWIQLNEGLTNTTIRSLLITKEGIMYAGTSGAIDYEKFSGEDIFVSRDRGKNWSLLTSGLNHPRIKALAINSKGILFAGTWGGGVYRSLYPIPTK